ncbi:cytochrome P450 [Artemisia annua]|uniref:Cytochrome P450 n=1 Tax=Artemisia annua TaxID=35608 RepID=A0A2U1KGC2_ARTAN|nr:cytochrome P450 [Artemisia annua]
MALLKDLGSWWWHVSNNNEFTIAVVSTISVVIIAIIIWYTLSLSSSSQTLLPGPRSLPIVGYLPFLNPEFHKQYTNLAHTYGPIFKIYFGSKLHIVIDTPELAKVVVRDQDEVFSNRDQTVAASAYSYEGRDLVFSNINSNWRNLRKIFVHEVLSNKNLEACRCFQRYEANVITSMVWENTYVKGTHDCDFGAELKVLSAKVSEIFGQPNLADFFLSLAWFDLQDLKDQKDPKSLNLIQIKALLSNVMLAGTDTTATLIEWTIAETMKNHTVMKRIQ